MTKKYNAAWDIFCTIIILGALSVAACNYTLWLM
jgi:predicted small secreted protein